MAQTLTLVTPPASEPITLADAKAHLRVIDTADDALIAGMLAAAREHTEKVLGRQLMQATWRATLDAFPREEWLEEPQRRLGESLNAYEGRRLGIKLTPCPVSSITSITYVSQDTGTTLTLASDRYTLVSDFVPALVVPAYGTYWPSTQRQPGAVRVTFVAGYANAASVPEPIKAYIKLLLGNLYEYREITVTGTITANLGFAERLLDNHRVY